MVDNKRDTERREAIARDICAICHQPAGCRAAGRCWSSGREVIAAQVTEPCPECSTPYACRAKGCWEAGKEHTPASMIDHDGDGHTAAQARYWTPLDSIYAQAGRAVGKTLEWRKAEPAPFDIKRFRDLDQKLHQGLTLTTDEYTELRDLWSRADHAQARYAVMTQATPKVTLGEPKNWTPVGQGLAYRVYPMGSNADDPLDNSWVLAFKGSALLNERHFRELSGALANAYQQIKPRADFPSYQYPISRPTFLTHLLPTEREMIDQAKRWGEAVHEVRVKQGETERKLRQPHDPAMNPSPSELAMIKRLYKKALLKNNGEGGAEKEFGLPPQREVHKVLLESMVEDTTTIAALVNNMLAEKKSLNAAEVAEARRQMKENTIPLQGEHHLGCQKVAHWEITGDGYPLEPTYSCDEHLAVMCGSPDPLVSTFVVGHMDGFLNQQRCCFISEK